MTSHGVTLVIFCLICDKVGTIINIKPGTNQWLLARTMERGHRNLANIHRIYCAGTSTTIIS